MAEDIVEEGVGFDVLVLFACLYFISIHIGFLCDIVRRKMVTHMTTHSKCSPPELAVMLARLVASTLNSA